MKKLFCKYLLLLLLLVGTGPALYAQKDSDFPEKPTPLQPVNDYAHVLSSAEAAQLSEKLRQYDRESSTTIIIVTIPSIGGYYVAE